MALVMAQVTAQVTAEVKFVAVFCCVLGPRAVLHVCPLYIFPRLHEVFVERAEQIAPDALRRVAGDAWYRQ